MQERYADILKMGDDQNDSAVLAFLRKWDMKPSDATAQLYKNLSAMKQAQNQLAVRRSCVKECVRSCVCGGRIGAM